ncbi:hypothetical protein E2C01_008143 [Portunus trituberculatus]|uniref:Uncharacterized protein n=1 Tax=Portunus trituberculatus TaxID=210409 RepID=A0A5B7D419_PORTR|nr:hypothetical protein [Portunus trituberculatus]
MPTSQPASPQPKPCVYVKICNSVSSVLLPFSTSALGRCELACVGRGEEDELPTTTTRAREHIAARIGYIRTSWLGAKRLET